MTYVGINISKNNFVVAFLIVSDYQPRTFPDIVKGYGPTYTGTLQNRKREQDSLSKSQ